MLHCFDEFDFDPDRLDLRRDGVYVDTEPCVLRLLAVLVRDAGHVVSKKELLERVWSGRSVCESVIAVAVARLRKVLGQGVGGRKFVVTVHGRGYRFQRPVVKVERSLAVARERPDAAVVVDAKDFVGRKTVMTRVRAALSDACQGRGNLCLLTGEPGIGKTRVVEQLVREADALGLSIAWGTCSDTDDTTPLWPFLQIVDELTKASAITRSSRSSTRHEEDAATSSLSGGDLATKSASRHEIFESILKRLVDISAMSPCVLILDDVHRADAASHELLRYMVDSISRMRVLVACTIPDADSVPNADLAVVAGHRNCTRISLDRLSAPAVGAYVEQHIGDPDGRFAQAVFLRSEGIPFYMVELVRQLLLSEQPSPETLRVPEAALEPLRPPLLALDAKLSGALSWAAVIGARFDLSTLAKAMGFSLISVMLLLDEAIVAKILRSTPTSKTIFMFAHELYREVLYDALTSSERRHHHLRVAQALEARQAHATPVSSAVLAYHRHAALPEGEIDKTVEACSMAAYDAARRLAFADSVMHLRHALEGVALRGDADPREHMGLLLRQAYDARASASPELQSAVGALVELARRHRSSFFMVHVGSLLSLHPGFPPWGGARGMLEEVLSWLGPEEHELHAVTLARLSSHGSLLYDARACAVQLERARALSELSGATFAQFNVLVAELYLNSEISEGQAGSDAEGRFQAFCTHTHPSPIAQIMLDLHRTITRMQRGELSGASAATSRAIAIARDLGSLELLWHAERFQAYLVLHEIGHDEWAIEGLRSLHRRARELRIVATELFTLYDGMLVLGDAADPGSVYRLCAIDPDDPPSVWSMKIRLLTAAREHAAARLLLAQVPRERLADLQHDRDYPGTLGALTQAALSLDAYDYLEALYPLLRAHRDKFAVHMSLLCEGSMEYLCGQIARALGMSALAHQHFAADRAFQQRTGFRVSQGHGTAALELVVGRSLSTRRLASN